MFTIRSYAHRLLIKDDTLCNVNLFGTNINDLQLAILIKLIQVNPQVRVVHLGHCSLDTKHLDDLYQLFTYKHLTSINLKHNNFNEDDILELKLAHKIHKCPATLHI